MLGWMSVGAVSSYRVQDGNDRVRLALQPNRDYYLSVRALDTGGEELGRASSQGWSIHQPFVFDVSQYPEITREAADSFWGVRYPDPRYSEFDDRFEAYMIGSAAVDVYKLLGELVLTGSSGLRILQTEGGFPGRVDVTRLGQGEGGSNHADTVAGMLYDCEFTESRQSYYRGCQISPQKYAMTGLELSTRLGEFMLTSQNADAFETSIFGDLGAPHVWSMAHAHPTSLQRMGDYASDQVAGLRLGDWMFSKFNIIAISPQPGSYAGHENPTLSGNYYNSIVAGKKSYTYAAQSSIDNENEPRFKPHIVVSASNLSEASSWSVPTLAAAASALLGPAHAEPLLAGATHMQTMKAILLAGAGKDYLCPESIAETEGSCNALPSRAEQWQWSNSGTAPLDPRYGVGLFNYRNSFDILVAGRSTGGERSKYEGWDTQELEPGQTVTYAFQTARANDAFSLVLTWNREIRLGPEGDLTPHLADFKVELLDGDNQVISRSDDPGNNIEHIYVPGGLEVGEHYSIVVTLKSSETATRYGLAWQARNSALRHGVWKAE